MNKKANYGLDAPGVVGWLSTIGLLLLILWIASCFLPSLEWARDLVWPGLSMSAGASLMVWSSYFGKFCARDRLFSKLQLKGSEILLDLGCGRGLLLIEAAKRLPQGKAVGIDLWSQHDLSRNTRQSVEENARLEGMIERMQILDGDMKKLPLLDSSVDLVVARFSIHNIQTQEGRREAVKEAVRVLRSGGRIAIMDFQFTKEYEVTLQELNLKDVRRSFFSFWNFPPSRTVYGQK
jgi:ubiquinone/menaquinone biosynthesis C-methylase UbiE